MQMLFFFRTNILLVDIAPSPTALCPMLLVHCLLSPTIWKQKSTYSLAEFVFWGQKHDFCTTVCHILSCDLMTCFCMQESQFYLFDTFSSFYLCMSHPTSMLCHANSLCVRTPVSLHCRSSGTLHTSLHCHASCRCRPTVPVYVS